MLGKKIKATHLRTFGVLRLISRKHFFFFSNLLLQYIVIRCKFLEQKCKYLLNMYIKVITFVTKSMLFYLRVNDEILREKNLISIVLPTA